MVARDIMTRDVESLRESATAREAAERLLALSYDGLPVVDDGRHVVGVVSYGDLMRLALPEYLEDIDLSFLPPSAQFFPAEGVGAVADRPVSAFMRQGYLPHVAPDEPVAEVARIMLKEDVRRVVVVEGGKLAGIISRGDIVRAIVSPLMLPDVE